MSTPCASKYHGVITCPAHDDLDLDLYNVRVVEVVSVGTDFVVTFKATDGRWIASDTGEWVTVHDASIDAAFGTAAENLQLGDAERWAGVADRLDGWRETDADLRMVAAPDRMTLLWDPATATMLPLPRSLPC